MARLQAFDDEMRRAPVGGGLQKTRSNGREGFSRLV
jgi:hypothetical protein